MVQFVGDLVDPPGAGGEPDQEQHEDQQTDAAGIGGEDAIDPTIDPEDQQSGGADHIQSDEPAPQQPVVHALSLLKRTCRDGAVARPVFGTGWVAQHRAVLQRLSTGCGGLVALLSIVSRTRTVAQGNKDHRRKVPECPNDREPSRRAPVGRAEAPPGKENPS
jgi:hypothetical protein